MPFWASLPGRRKLSTAFPPTLPARSTATMTTASHAPRVRQWCRAQARAMRSSRVDIGAPFGRRVRRQVSVASDPFGHIARSRYRQPGDLAEHSFVEHPPHPMTMPIRGRDREIAVLAAAVEDAARGGAGVVVLEGEAGIGKTRLVDETAIIAARAGLIVAVGAAD